MSKQREFLWFAGLAVLATLAAPALWPQAAAPPTSYSVTQINAMFGTPVTMTVYRDGSKALIDNLHDGKHTRSLYDLQAHTNYTWDPANLSVGCSSGSFSGDWGDPFASSDINQLTKSATKAPGSETVNGFATKVVEAVDPKSNIKIKVWQDVKTGLIIKADMTPPGGSAATTIIETKQFSPAKPAASLFTLPEACAKAGPPVHVPTASERFAAETGGNGADFVDATRGPGSPNACAMLLRVVRAGSMQPIANFQVAVDLTYDFDHPPHYVIGVGSAGHSTFSGGGLKEYTSQLRNGVLRLENVPDHFDLELSFGTPGTSSSLVYRHCAGRETVLLYVVKNDDKISDGGDLMWVKSGKYAH